jgi:DNA mismatch endonuclease (patch repair protein)
VREILKNSGMFKKGQIPWNKGLTKETDERLKGFWLGKKRPPFSEKWKTNIGLGEKGRKKSEDWKKKIGLANSKHSSWIKGKHHKSETIQKMREKRSKQIIPQKDTSIEIKIQEGLKKLNIPFETHKVIERFIQCDIFIEPNIVIFADGCWWHGCEQCHDKNKFLRFELGKKILLRKTVDNMIGIKLMNKGFKVLRFWEHDIKKNFEDKVLDEIIFTLNEAQKVM